jgi:hypothetical protein
MNPTTLMITVPLQANETNEQAVARVDRFVAEVMRPPLKGNDRMAAKYRFAELGTNTKAMSAAGQNLYFVAFSAGRRFQLGIDSTDFGARIDEVTTERFKNAAEAIFDPHRHAAVVARPE